ncbi:hypothetical protein [Luteimonas cellulosilyticus]|uniref:hypothetical protein n=1 Tax=Luteimonas cellulosilyticus TaxID=2683586 RepID=UPI00135AA548|nr:hypothetical protein [Luteimonas cellulosilyticus]
MADTEDTELFSGLHMIIAAPPLDPRVDAVLFRTRRGTQYAWGDERADAQAAVERYLDESVITRLIPYDRQLEGQRTVLVYTRPELALPEIGEVYALKNELDAATEFIRVEDIDHQVETFTDINGDYKARVITLTITQPLSREFSGSQPNRFFTVDTGRSVLRKTIASDAARYKGVVRLAEDAQPGDLIIKVESVYSQLVPAATSEVGVTDAGPGGSVIDEPSGLVLLSISTPISSANRKFSIPVGAVPGTVRIRQTDAVGAGAVIWQQRVDGSFYLVSGSSVPSGDWSTTSETTFEFSQNLGTGFVIHIEWLPATRLAKPGQSWQMPVEIQNRGYVYTGTLRPVPAPGATSLVFRALGQWYTLQDDGTGALRGEPGVGSGLINFQTGSFSASLGALPDIGSSVIVSFAGGSEYQILVGDLDIKVPAVQLTLEAGNVEPSSLSLSWLAGGTLRTATDNGAGQLTGDGTGRVLYGTGEVELVPNLLPDSNATLTAGYEAGVTTQEIFTPALTGANLVLTLAAPPRPGSIRIAYLGYAVDERDAAYEAQRVLRDNGTGALVDDQGTLVAGSTINYATGQITFPADFLARVGQAQRSSFGQVMPAREIDPLNRSESITSNWVTA